VITAVDVWNVLPGMTVTGTGIVPGTKVATINYDTRELTLDTATSAAAANSSTITFGGAADLDRTLTLGGSNLGDNTFGSPLVNPTGGTGKLSLQKADSGKWILSGANTYSGATTISGGTLGLSGSGSIANSTNISVASGATLDVSAVSFTLGTAQTLSGNGTVNGTLTVAGTLAPGASIGTLTIGGALTLVSGATAAMELGDSLAADKAAASGAVTYAGKLKLTWTGGTMTAGGPYTLFAGSSFSGAFAALELVNWPDSTKRVNLANLTTDGTISLIANTAPTALGLSLPVEKNLAAAFTLAKYAQDAEGDPLVTTFSTPSHGAVALAGGIVTYTPTTDYTGPDSYTYTVTDPYGASATATVAVTVSGPSGNGANIVSVTVAVPTATVKALGIPGATYSLQYIDDLATDTWHDLSGTATAATTGPNIGQFVLTDTSAPATGRFYRTKYVSGP
jgi:autotransporter-associated beta strand protein